MAALAIETPNYARHYIPLDSEVNMVVETVILSTGVEVAVDYTLEPGH
jgi:hypothetical protein